MERNFLRIKVLSLSLFFLLVISSLAIASADSLVLNSNHAKRNDIEKIEKEISVPTTGNSQNSREFQVDLNEGLSMNTNDIPSQGQQNVLTTTKTSPTIQTKINLSEKLQMKTNSPNQNLILIEKQISDNKAIMERIWNTERVRIGGRSVIVDNALWGEQSSVDKISTLTFDDRQFLEQYSMTRNLENNLKGAMTKILSVPFSISDISKIANNDVTIFFGVTNSIRNDLVGVAYGVVDTKNPTILLFLVPLSGYILIRAEEARLEFFKTKNAFGLIFVIILLSSIFVTPLSESSHYWGDRKSTRLNSSHIQKSRMPSSA